MQKNIDVALGTFGPAFRETTFFDAPNFLLLVCAVAFVAGELPTSVLTADVDHKRGVGLSHANAANNLPLLATAVENDDIDGPHVSFVVSSKSSTQRTSSRRPRFAAIVNAIAA